MRLPFTVKQQAGDQEGGKAQKKPHAPVTLEEVPPLEKGAGELG